MAISSFLEAFQRVADMATNSKGKFTEFVDMFFDVGWKTHTHTQRNACMHTHTHKKLFHCVESFA